MGLSHAQVSVGHEKEMLDNRVFEKDADSRGEAQRRRPRRGEGCWNNKSGLGCRGWKAKLWYDRAFGCRML